MDKNGEIDASFMNSDERAGWSELMEVLKMENQNPQWNISVNSPEAHINNLPQSLSTPALLQQNPHSSNQNQMTRNASTSKPFLRIVEQPAPKKLRFRYECEGRSAGSIPGVNSTPDNKTFPTIEIMNYDKDAVVVVSCVTKDPPYRPHPHKIVGRDGGGQKYDNGICEVTLKGQPLRAVFSNLGIQCVKRREVATSLSLRRDRKINPFNVPYPSNDQRPTYDLNVVRLCFQAFINPTGKRWEPLEPQISDPIYDKKGVFELKICQLCSCAGKVHGGDRIILLCEKIDKNDIKIKFSECNNEGEIKWADYADFQQSDIHKNTAIVFKTPRYERTDISDPVKVYIQLERPSDGGLSEPLEFEYHPDPDSLKRKRFRYDKFKEDISELTNNFPNNGFLMNDTKNWYYQDPNLPATTNNLETTLPAFTIPQLKAESAPSPDYNIAQQSPYSVINSPQQSPSPVGMQYATLQPSSVNMNQLSPTATTSNYMQQLPTTSGGSFTPINHDQPINQNIPNSFSFKSNIPLQTNNNSSMDFNSEDRLEMMNHLIAGKFETFCNIFSNSLTDNATGSELPEEGLTVSGLMNELAGQPLVEMASLSVSDEV